jgi:RNA polymerase sigma factor (sigma-70 family)
MHDAEKLFTAHAPALYRYLLRLTGDSDLAADCVQDTFVRLLDRGHGRDVERAWLFTVATNLAIQARRTSSRRARLLDGAGDRGPIGDNRPSPLEHIEALERHQQAVRALASLSDKERTAVLMREEGFSHKEIADAVGTTTGSVGTLLARALLKFAEAVGDAAP